MKCLIEGCDNHINPRSKLDVCSNCRHGLYYWMKLPASRVLERQRKLKIWGNRLTTLSISPEDVKGNMTVKTVINKRSKKRKP